MRLNQNCAQEGRDDWLVLARSVDTFVSKRTSERKEGKETRTKFSEFIRMFNPMYSPLIHSSVSLALIALAEKSVEEGRRRRQSL